MSDPTYQTKIYGRGGGSVLTVDSAGTVQVLSGGQITIAAGGSFVNGGNQSLSGNVVIASGGSLSVASGGSVQVAAGGQVQVAANTGFSAPLGITLGGTAGRWAFGTAAITAGVGTIATGMIRVLSAVANPILGEAPGLGSFTTVMVDLSLSAAGTVIFHAGAGTLPYTNNGVVSWFAMGT